MQFAPRHCEGDRTHPKFAEGSQSMLTIRTAPRVCRRFTFHAGHSHTAFSESKSACPRSAKSCFTFDAQNEGDPTHPKSANGSYSMLNIRTAQSGLTAHDPTHTKAASGCTHPTVPTGARTHSETEVSHQAVSCKPAQSQSTVRILEGTVLLA